ncbi:winged helix-turn-helix domain-containing protein [Rheinheimera sp. 1928-s]|uniref:winged helix-turn-helix domain-containing protein n=1 Tax=Rheinheimera sp. 1928-s TaxID=3033803 RepID=UPI002615A6AB|nr:winged helix-turn-helix domain-containing protein [Rheinheimera sp. 1928-s]MDF3127087.1 winged helix-turn-helix domain-containing protein [Rheinheimera sp. 1928-s]
MRQLELLDLIVEPDEYKVYRIVNPGAVDSDKQELDLPKLSFELLIYLMEHAEKVCTVEQISAAVWKNTIVSSETITQRITLLRKALDDDPKQPKYIESVRGRGYRLLAKPIDKSVVKPTGFSSSTAVVLAVLTVFALLSIALVLYWMAGNDTAVSDTSATNAGSHASNPVELLIERGNYYFSTGQGDNTNRSIELFNQALKLEPNNQAALIGLSVALSKSVCRYNQPAERAMEAKQYVMQALALEGSRTDKSKAQAALAYAWDCLGNLDHALEAYRVSIQLDPKNYASMGSAAHLLEAKGQLIQAYELTLKAKQLLPNNHMADLQLSRIFELLNFTSKAQLSYQQLFVLYPDNVFINAAYPRFLYFQGRFTEAKKEIEKVLKRGIKRDEVFVYYAELVWLLEGKEKSLPWFTTAAEVSSGNTYPNTLAQIANNQLTTQEAIKRLSSIEETVASGDSWPINYIEASLIALWAVKDEEAALSYLQKAVHLGYLNSEYLAISPLFAALKQRPEFYQLIDDINQRREKMHQQFLTTYPPPET